jgi:hypothetical protein
MRRPLEPGTSSLGWYGDDDPRPVREVYGAFRRPQNDADRVATELVRRLGTLTGLDIEFDDVDGRLLLEGLGGDHDLIYAVPVAVDRLAYAVLPNGGGQSGARPGPDGLLLMQNQTEAMDLLVYGLAGDEIESVDLAVAGVIHEARMGENAFGLRLEHTHEADVERIVLHRRDGTPNAIGLRPEG